MPRQIRLNLNLQTAGRHDAAWKRFGDTSELVTDVDYYVSIAKLAERGKLDAIFLALVSTVHAIYGRPFSVAQTGS